VDWEENLKICCSLGLKPLMVESAAQAQCISKWTNGSHLSFIFDLPNFFKGNWNLNFNYWTSGLKQGQAGQWNWCDPGQGSKALDTGLVVENKTNQDCIHFKIGRNGTDLKLAGKSCSSKFIFACQTDVSVQQVASECTRNVISAIFVFFCDIKIGILGKSL